MRKGSPPINLAHLRVLNDRVGVIQYAPYSKPDLTWGYTTDDVARAIVFICRASGVMEQSEQKTLAREYVAFLDKMRASHGRWSNEMSKDGGIVDLPSDRDHVGPGSVSSGLPCELFTFMAQFVSRIER